MWRIVSTVCTCAVFRWLELAPKTIRLLKLKPLMHMIEKRHDTGDQMSMILNSVEAILGQPSQFAKAFFGNLCSVRELLVAKT